MTDFTYYPRPALFEKDGNSPDAVNYNPTAANYYRNRCAQLELALADALSRLPLAEVPEVLGAVDLEHF